MYQDKHDKSLYNYLDCVLLKQILILHLHLQKCPPTLNRAKGCPTGYSPEHRGVYSSSATVVEIITDFKSTVSGGEVQSSNNIPLYTFYILFVPPTPYWLQASFLVYPRIECRLVRPRPRFRGPLRYGTCG